jgi:aminoglycoside 6'-N-acetyltransferase
MTGAASARTGLRFRPLRRDDFPLLGTWLAAPHVRRWWPEDPDPAALEAAYGPAVDGPDPTELFVAEHDGHPIGFVQRYRLVDNPAWQRALAPAGAPTDGAGIDYLIGEEQRTGQGLGPSLIAAFVDDTWPRYPGVSAVVVGVLEENRRSWRALEKAGFLRIRTGQLDSHDPSDAGISAVYVRTRPDDHP